MILLKSFLLIIKGFVIGIGKVIPGVSGSMLAISLGLYEKCLDAITHFFQNIAQNFYLLFHVGIGVLLAIVLGSKIIAFFMAHYYLSTMLLFLGMIMGGMPNQWQHIQLYRKTKSHFFFFLLAFFFVISLSFINVDYHYLVSPHVKNWIYLAIGFLDATTMVIPGISGTAVFMLLGLYQISIGMFASLTSISNIIQNSSMLLPFAVGLILGIFLISWIMTYLLKHYEEKTYFAIFGFQLAAIVMIFIETLQFQYTLLEITGALLCFMIGFRIALRFERME